MGCSLRSTDQNCHTIEHRMCLKRSFTTESSLCVFLHLNDHQAQCKLAACCLQCLTCDMQNNIDLYLAWFVFVFAQAMKFTRNKKCTCIIIIFLLGWWGETNDINKLHKSPACNPHSSKSKTFFVHPSSDPYSKRQQVPGIHVSL